MVYKPENSVVHILLWQYQWILRVNGINLAALNLFSHYSLSACILLGKISSLLQLWHTDFTIAHVLETYLRLPLVLMHATVTQASWQALV